MNPGNDHETMCVNPQGATVGVWTHCRSDGTCNNGAAILKKCVERHEKSTTTAVQNKNSLTLADTPGWSYTVNPSNDHETMCVNPQGAAVGGWTHCRSDGTCNNGAAILKKCVERHGTPTAEDVQVESKNPLTSVLSEVAKAMLPALEGYAAQKRIDNAQNRVTKLKQSGNWTMNEYGSALGELQEAKSHQQYLKTIDRLLPKYQHVNARFTIAQKTKGNEVDNGKNCLAEFDRARHKGEVVAEFGSTHYVNLCESVTVEIFHCRYLVPTKSNPTPSLACAEDPYKSINFKGRHEQALFDTPDSRGLLITEAFCPKGSKPQGKYAFNHTQKTGTSSYQCVWR